MSEWICIPLEQLADISSGGTPSRAINHFWNGAIPWVTPTDISKCKTNYIYETQNSITSKGLSSSSAKLLPKGALLFTSRATIGEVKISARPISTNQGFKNLVPKGCIDGDFLYYQLVKRRNEFIKYAAGSTFLEINRKDTGRVLIPHPKYKKEQQKIARILQTTDQAIEKTKALIEKYQHIKAGLMYDLFTRGIGADGKLRPPREQAPELYQESPIGWIPKEWGHASIEAIKSNLVDGPFGTNLKTEHYVSDPGTRVVRLQNIQSTKYSDADRAFISDKHANSLHRNKVTGGDVLIAGLGDDRYPVGRACLYPDGLPPAINKADCFRLRCIEGFIDNGFLMYFLNTAAARVQVRKYEQGECNIRSVNWPEAGKATGHPLFFRWNSLA